MDNGTIRVGDGGGIIRRGILAGLEMTIVCEEDAESAKGSI